MNVIKKKVEEFWGMVIRLTGSHLVMSLFVVWVLAGLPSLVWWMLTQFITVSLLQVYLPAWVLVSLIGTVESYIVKGQADKERK